MRAVAQLARNLSTAPKVVTEATKYPVGWGRFLPDVVANSNALQKLFPKLYEDNLAAKDVYAAGAVSFTRHVFGNLENIVKSKSFKFSKADKTAWDPSNFQVRFEQDLDNAILYYRAGMAAMISKVSDKELAARLTLFAVKRELDLRIIDLQHSALTTAEQKNYDAIKRCYDSFVRAEERLIGKPFHTDEKNGDVRCDDKIKINFSELDGESKTLEGYSAIVTNENGLVVGRMCIARLEGLQPEKFHLVLLSNNPSELEKMKISPEVVTSFMINYFANAVRKPCEILRSDVGYDHDALAGLFGSDDYSRRPDEFASSMKMRAREVISEYYKNPEQRTVEDLNGVAKAKDSTVTELRKPTAHQLSTTVSRLPELG
jgi:hypothetical protein